MPAKLHPERFRELAPEFEIAECFLSALEVIERANPRTDGVSRAHHFAHHGLQCLHPATRDPEAREEMRARLDGTYQGGGGPGPQGGGGGELARLQAELAGLERQKAERETQAKIDALRGELAQPTDAKPDEPPKA